MRRPNPRRRSGPEDVWKLVQAELPSKEGYRIVWMWNSMMAQQDSESRQARIEKAYLEIERLQTKLQGKRCRLRLRERVEQIAQNILRESGAQRWVRIQIEERQQPIYRQERRGHPGQNTRYLRKQRLRFSVVARIKDTVIAADERSDGMFPLITNCKDLSLKAILEAYKFQLKLEKRHEQLKSVQDLAPVWLKKVSRIEALLFLYFIALLVHALLEREIRQRNGPGGAPCASRFILRSGSARRPVRSGCSMSSRLFRDTGCEEQIGWLRSLSPSSVIFIGRSWILFTCRLMCFEASCESVARYRVRSLRKIGHMDGVFDTGNTGIGLARFDGTNPRGQWVNDVGNQTGSCSSMDFHVPDTVDWYGTLAWTLPKCVVCHDTVMGTKRQVLGARLGTFIKNPIM